MRNHALDVAALGESVIPGVNADRLEHLGVFRQAALLEAGFSKLAAIHVSLLVVKHSSPAGIFPRGCSDEHPVACKLGQLLPEFFTFKLHWPLFNENAECGLFIQVRRFTRDELYGPGHMAPYERQCSRYRDRYDGDGRHPSGLARSVSLLDIKPGGEAPCPDI